MGVNKKLGRMLEVAVSLPFKKFAIAAATA
jgi:hypothetical protein